MINTQLSSSSSSSPQIGLKCCIFSLFFINVIYYLIYRTIWTKHQISNTRRTMTASSVQLQVSKHQSINQAAPFCANPDVALQNVCSLAHALNIHADDNWPWQERQCYFVNRGNCSTWNIHHYLTNDGQLRREAQSTSYASISPSPSSSTSFASSANTNNSDNDNNDNNNKKFSILINTWQRNECLIQSVEHYLQCEDVAQIRVIWSDPSNDVPWQLVELQSTLPDRSRLVFDEYKDDKLTNRFKYNAEWITDALFHTDDDHLYSCALLSNTFKLWRLIPDYMIGFAARMPRDDLYQTEGAIQSKQKQKLKGKAKPYQFYHYSTAYKQCEYSLHFSTLGGFMHRKYCQMYTRDDVNGVQNAWKTIRNSVDGNITGEDFTMSLLYTYQSGLAPITVVVPESESYSEQFAECDAMKSETMHTNSEKKRNDIFVDTLRVLGYYHKPKSFTLKKNTLFVDVMPFHEHNCAPI